MQRAAIRPHPSSCIRLAQLLPPDTPTQFSRCPRVPHMRSYDESAAVCFVRQLIESMACLEGDEIVLTLDDDAPVRFKRAEVTLRSVKVFLCM